MGPHCRQAVVLCQSRQPVGGQPRQPAAGKAQGIHIVVARHQAEAGTAVPNQEFQVEPLNVVAHQHVVAEEVQKHRQNLLHSRGIRDHLVRDVVHLTCAPGNGSAGVYQAREAIRNGSTADLHGRYFNHLIAIAGNSRGFQVKQHIIRHIAIQVFPLCRSKHSKSPIFFLCTQYSLSRLFCQVRRFFGAPGWGTPFSYFASFFSKISATCFSKERISRCWGQISSHWPHSTQSDALPELAVWTS